MNAQTHAHILLVDDDPDLLRLLTIRLKAGIPTHGWAYGTGGDAFRGRKVALGVTAGIREADFTPQGKWKMTLAQLLAPFDVTFNYIGAESRQFFAFYGAEDGPKEAGYAERLARSAHEYVGFLAAL